MDNNTENNAEGGRAMRWSERLVRIVVCVALGVAIGTFEGWKYWFCIVATFMFILEGAHRMATTVAVNFRHLFS